MNYRLELFHSQLSAYKQFAGTDLICEGTCDGSIILTLPSSNVKNSIWFYPWQIVPKIRVDDFLVDPGLAGIDLFDHKLDVILDDNFFQRYREQDLFYRQQSIGVNDAYIYDSVIGIGNMHYELVDQIQKAMAID